MNNKVARDRIHARFIGKIDMDTSEDASFEVYFTGEFEMCNTDNALFDGVANELFEFPPI